jgi:RNase P/RNase MRP subunit POP5
MPVRSVRRRYLWVHLETNTELNEAQINKLIEAKIHFLYGVNGFVEMNFKQIEFLPEKNDAIIRCNHNRLNEMRAMLASITAAGGNPCRVDVKLVSGTIKALRKHMS